jgi:hypothetical protein
LDQQNLAPAARPDNDPSHMHVRRAITLAVALVVALVAKRANAWQEAHQTGDDARVVVDPDGVASVLHELRWHIVRGPLKAIDLANVDPGAVVQPNVSIATDDGRALTAQAVRRDDKTVRVSLDEPRALSHGNITLQVRWRIDLVAARAITRDGGTWRLVWSAPAALDGFDGARTTFDLPAAPSEPHPILPETGAIDDGAVATLRRGPERDVLELVRPHVARAESATWTLRVDPRALPLVVDPRLRPPAETARGSGADPATAGVGRAPPEPDRVREALLGFVLMTLGLAFGRLVFHKARAFATACAPRAARAKGILPLPPGPRAALAGASLAAGVGLEMVGETTAGAAFVGLAALAAALRAPSAPHAVRGPGRWQAWRPEQAFARPGMHGHWLDIGSAAGRVSALVACVLLVLAAAFARRFDPDGGWIVALDAVVLVPLLITGRASQLPPEGARAAAPWLARAFRRMRVLPGVSVAPWARVAPDGATADELRLLVLPRVAMPGVIGVEVGLAWSSTPVCWAATPEVLARVLDGSAAAAKLAREVPGVLTVPGRRPDERVVRLLPRAPTPKSTVMLVRALAEVLTDRRIATLPGRASPPRRRRWLDWHPPRVASLAPLPAETARP